jgi:hypothetical protein
MPFIQLGAASELQIKVPTLGTTSWGDTLRTDTFQKIAEHDHTGSGKGKQLGAGSIAADSLTGAKIRLDNDESLRARDNADANNVNLLKLNTSDQLELETAIAAIKLVNDIYITARNAADDADVNLLRLNSLDQLELGPQIASLNLVNDTYLTARNAADSANIDIVKVNASDEVLVEPHILEGAGSVTLTDNTAVATSAGVIALSTNEACEVKYRLVRGTNVQKGTLEFDEDNTGIIEEFSGDDCGITFSNNAGALEYVSTNTGNDATMTYVVIKK